MIFWLLVGLIVNLLVIGVVLWKFGFIHQAEIPESIDDKPVTDPKERRAVLKRLNRWKEEGKITREEFEHLDILFRSEWD